MVEYLGPNRKKKAVAAPRRSVLRRADECRPVTKLPEGKGWLYELKLDGYRAILIKDGSKVAQRSRNDKDLASAYPPVVAAAHRITADKAVLDGEIVMLDPHGRPSFNALQHRGVRALGIRSYSMSSTCCTWPVAT